jgi:hypothetical protein
MTLSEVGGTAPIMDWARASVASETKCSCSRRHLVAFCSCQAMQDNWVM